MNRTVSTPSAAYGQACLNCVKAKCKCIPRESGSSCDRCHRLRKDCQPSLSIRKKNAQKPARKSQLEDKLDNLVTLLQAQQAPTISLTSSIPHHAIQSEPPLSCASNTPLTSTNPLPSEQTPQQVLSIFCKRYLEYCPFIYIPTDESSSETFVRERPNTYRAIQVICEKSRERQIEFGVRVREELVLRVVTGGERSIDLLLCVLVCLAWQVYFTPSRRGGMSMFVNIAKVIIADLGYNRPTAVIMACPKPPVIVGQLPDQHEAHNDEERRALVGCFTFAAMAAIAIKTEPMRWSSRISKACEKLSHNLGNEGDMNLVAMARISRVSVDACNALQQVQDDPESAPYAIHQIRALRVMLDVVKGGLTPEQLQNNMVLCYLYNTEVQIHEPVLYGIAHPTANTTVEYQRIEYLTACLHACKASLDNYLKIPAITMNMVQVLAFSNTCQVLYTLSVIDLLGWDRITVRATADILWYFDQVVRKFEEAYHQLKEENGGTENIFSLAGGHEGLKTLSARWKENLETATGTAFDFTGEFGGVDDQWMTNADMWFTNVWGDAQI